MDALKRLLFGPVMLARPDFSQPFLLQTDWQPHAIAAILSQKDTEGRERPVAYASKKLTGPESRWGATEGECYAAVPVGPSTSSGTTYMDSLSAWRQTTKR